MMWSGKMLQAAPFHASGKFGSVAASMERLCVVLANDEADHDADDDRDSDM